jgi:extracellular factor (EF) 3-hydroxypalmitic acid methyl ester biosynthesis protein
MQNGTPLKQATALEAVISCENSHGARIQGTLLRLSRHEASFEIYSAAEIVQMSEVLSNFKVVVRDQPIYSGQAVVASLINAGPVIICQVSLKDAWLELDVVNLAKQPSNVPTAFADLIQGWQKVYRIDSDYKVIIADIQSFLFELRHWVEEIELGVSSSSNGNRWESEKKVVDELVKPVTPCLNHLFQRFEERTGAVSQEMQPAYGIYVKRHLHPLLLCAPFMHRIYRKPLGYAGDYEMVNMILRDPQEGSSLFAKVLNSWFLSQVPAEAHRNRIKFLCQRLAQETARAHSQNRTARFYNLGCGPAQEVRNFMEQSELSNHAEFTLLDFNEETLAFTRQSLEETRRRFNRSTRIQLIKKSVAQVMKSGARNTSPEYDMIYCAGLYDYLPDRVCLQLDRMFYEMLNPGGLLVLTNVDNSNPIRSIMGYIFEWRLIERNAEQMRRLIPAELPVEDAQVTSDSTGCNLLVELRKPAKNP